MHCPKPPEQKIGLQSDTMPTPLGGTKRPFLREFDVRVTRIGPLLAVVS